MKVVSSLFVLMFLLCSFFVENPKVDRSGYLKGSNKKQLVAFEFCLLNQNGNPSKTFSVNENFSFVLNIQNNSNDSLFLDNSFLLGDHNGFCVVYNENGKVVGKPFIFCGAKMVSSSEHPFEPKKNYKLQIPWSDSRKSWTELHCTFKGAGNKSLPQGKYYTLLKHRFVFDRVSKESLCIDVDQRIDFEIK